jgi:hypothetical protein
MMESGKSLARVGAVLVIVSVAIAAALVGGASTSRAATSFSFDFHPLIGTPAENEIPQVTYGGAIGYSIHIENNGDSNATQVFIRAKNTNGATFLDASNPNCGPNSNDTQQMICSVPGDTLKPGDTFDTNFRFTAPSTGAQVSMTVEVVIKAQSIGGKKNGNNGTVVSSSSPVLTNIVAGGDKADTYLRASEPAATTNRPQHFSLLTPLTLLGNPFGVALSIHDHLEKLPGCSDCWPSYTELTIPDAALTSTEGNPFFDGTTSNPYSWSMDAVYTGGFQLHHVVHLDFNNQLTNVVSCASLVNPDTNPLGNPTTGQPFCYTNLQQFPNGKQLHAEGRAIENGGLGWN